VKRILPRVRAVRERFFLNHRKVVKYCEFFSGIFVGYETHLVPITVVCVIWVVIDGWEIIAGTFE